MNSRPVFNNNANARPPYSGGEPPREHHEAHRERPESKRSSRLSLFNYKTSSVVLLFGIVIIVVAILIFIGFGKTGLETSYVNKDDYQSVFVNVSGTSGGQAYFGKIVAIRDNYIVLDNVFYLESGSSSNQFTLNRLTCALYEPNDQMVINRQQVDFWENLSSTSTVTQDINKWISNNLSCPATSTAPATSTTTTSPSPSPAATTTK
jgi:hypothetical protein